MDIDRIKEMEESNLPTLQGANTGYKKIESNGLEIYAPKNPKATHTTKR